MRWLNKLTSSRRYFILVLFFFFLNFMTEIVKHSASVYGTLLNFRTEIVKHSVSVYGTLKRWFGNHRLIADSEFVWEYLVPFYAFKSSGIPFLSVVGDPSEFKGYMKVETYSVTDDELVRLDRLEGHPNWYVRTPVSLYKIDETNTENPIVKVGETEVYHYSVPQNMDRSEDYLIANGIYEWTRS